MRICEVVRQKFEKMFITWFEKHWSDLLYINNYVGISLGVLSKYPMIKFHRNAFVQCIFVCRLGNQIPKCKIMNVEMWMNIFSMLIIIYWTFISFRIDKQSYLKWILLYIFNIQYIRLAWIVNSCHRFGCSFCRTSQNCQSDAVSIDIWYKWHPMNGCNDIFDMDDRQIAMTLR